MTDLPLKAQDETEDNHPDNNDDDDEEEDDDEEYTGDQGDIEDEDDDDDNYDDEDDDNGESDEEGVFTVNGELRLEEAPTSNGTPSYRLAYRGDAVQLVSKEVMPWNLLDANATPLESMCTLTMQGTCEVHSPHAKPTPRTLHMTWTQQDASSSTTNHGKKRSHNDDDDDDDDDGNAKQKSTSGKTPSYEYILFGQEVHGNHSEALQLRGSYAPHSPSTSTAIASSFVIPLQCQARWVPAIQAAMPARPHGDNDDDDDELEEDRVDYEELIALHEEAGLSVDAIQKRYRETTAHSSKRLKTDEAARPKDDNEDDNDDYGF
jgi:hypothetical protein